MENFRELLNRHAFAISLLIVAGYFVVFAYPAIHSSKAFGHGESVSEVGSMISQLPLETGLVVSVLALIGILGWWRGAGFRKVNRPGLKFAIAPAIFTGLLLGVGAIFAEVNGSSIWQIVGVSHLLVLLLVTLFVGIFEECLFRGILFRGAGTKFGPLTVVLITAVIFGSMHYVNFIGGQALGETTVQVIHAAIAGFMYGMLRLMIGAIWPVILLHGFWDATVSTIGATFAGIAESPAAATATETAAGINPGSFVIMLPELLYGLFLIWSWSRWNENQKVDFFG